MAPPLKVPPHLPRELKDVILTHLIHHPSHTRNPAYQWTVLRHLTPYHRRQLELYFRTFWLPTLILTIYYRKSVSVDFRAERMHKDGRTVRFRAREGWDELMKEFGYGKEADVEICWTRRIWRGIAGGNLYEAAAGASGLRMVWRLGVGEGVLNGGLGGGWIVSDALVRGIRVGDGGEFIWVDWRAVFDEILGDEMRMRKWTETLVGTRLGFRRVGSRVLGCAS
ncbi:hypothetical protein P154DRAFT_327787 [Amniculicola lignicola CBS 123094]|uniref:Uncharacterized protein n=1 Tax=Amniculicola lignicola CBS 123094 TaxID=1392246 RepID=A0A6A5W2J2_9PLEO|nr:hypothetical protein P154DRAFT_327787 [Amniculicola lignicola CBS 123094]